MDYKVPLIYGQMNLIMKGVGPISKAKRNQQQGFSYRGIDDLYNALNGIMSEHGVFTTIEELSRTDTIREAKSGGKLYHSLIKFEISFIAFDGSSVKFVLTGEGLDSGDKATNKCISIAHKYALLTAFMIPTEDLADPDHERPEEKHGTSPGPSHRTLHSNPAPRSTGPRNPAQTLDPNSEGPPPDWEAQPFPDEYALQHREPHGEVVEGDHRGGESISAPPQRNSPESSASPIREPAPNAISEKQQKMFWAVAKKKGWGNEEVRMFLKHGCKVEHTYLVLWKDFQKILKTIESAVSLDDAIDKMSHK